MTDKRTPQVPLAMVLAASAFCGTGGHGGSRPRQKTRAPKSVRAARKRQKMARRKNR